MKCRLCDEKAVLSSPNYCKKHFIEYFERKVFRTIEDYGLLDPSDSVCVAASGGKDSTVALYLSFKYLQSFRSDPKVTALIIDEGISGYRNKTLDDLKRFCKDAGIPLKVVSFRQEFGRTLDQIITLRLTDQKPCTVCGILRRYLLNKYSRGFDKLVTGHNLDDESQAILMNLFRQQTDILARLGPVSGVSRDALFVQRVKPLYFCPEKEVALYAVLKGFDVSFTECPYVVFAYRADVRDFLNAYEQAHKGAKLNIVRSFLKVLPELKASYSGKGLRYCESCGEPSSQRVCNACKLADKIIIARDGG